MALKKSELYNSLWASCDELRGGMDASQYKDYVLVLLFIKYIKQLEIEKYSRMVSVTEIEANDFNLNIPRYIDSQEAEDIQDIEAHLRGDIPVTDIDALQQYWEVYPSLKKVLFNSSRRAKYSQPAIHHSQLKDTIFSHPEFTDYSKKVDTVFSQWKIKNMLRLKGLAPGDKPKKLIHEISEDLLESFSNVKLIDKYDVYQHLMVYWSETMQDDVYTIVSDGWDSRLIPKGLIIARYFAAEQKVMGNLETDRDAITRPIEEMEEEHSGEEGLMADAKNDKDKITKASVQKRIKELNGAKSIPPPLTGGGQGEGELRLSSDEDELTILKQYLTLSDHETSANKKIKEAQSALEKKVLEQYKILTEAEIKTIVVEDKWMAALERDIKTEMDRISQRLTGRIKELAERYETPLPELNSEVEALEKKVNEHLEKMGFIWK